MRVPTYILLVAAAALLSITAIWLPVFPAMTDVPQHAAQMAVIAHYNDPAFGFSEHYYLDFVTPYLLTYLIGAMLTKVVGAAVATKILITLAVTGTAASVHWLTRVADRDPWLALLAWPLTFSATFYWGFLPFLVSVPLGICTIALALRLCDEYSPTLTAAATIMALVTSVTHPLTGLFTCMAVFAMGIWPIDRRIFRRVLPVLPAGLLLLVWGLATASAAATARSTIPAEQSHPLRLLQLPLTVLWGGEDTAASIFGVLLCTCVLIALVHGWRKGPLALAVPGIIALAAYLFLPEPTFDTHIVYPRFAALALLLFIPVGIAPPQRSYRALVAVCVLGWLGNVVYRANQFADESDEFASMIARIPSNQRVASLIYAPSSDVAPAYPYSHFPAWYQALKGGSVPYAIANHHAVVVQKRIPEPDSRAWHTPGLALRTVADADYVLIRMDEGQRAPPLPDAPQLVSQGRYWSLWQR